MFAAEFNIKGVVISYNEKSNLHINFKERGFDGGLFSDFFFD